MQTYKNKNLASTGEERGRHCRTEKSKNHATTLVVVLKKRATTGFLVLFTYSEPWTFCPETQSRKSAQSGSVCVSCWESASDLAEWVSVFWASLWRPLLLGGEEAGAGRPSRSSKGCSPPTFSVDAGFAGPEGEWSARERSESCGRESSEECPENGPERA